MVAQPDCVLWATDRNLLDYVEPRPCRIELYLS